MTRPEGIGASMIETHNLTKLYGNVAAVKGVSFQVGQGEIVGFLGPNGAGKSTTMRVITGFSPPTDGTAVVAGFDVTKHPIEVKRRIGYLPENVPLYPEMVVRAFLSYVADIKGVPRRERDQEVDRVVARCGLEAMSNRLIGNLSKGYRQRTGLAQALVGNPPVLILDEPTVGLDPRQIVEIRNMIKELAEEHTVLLSTHILPEVAMLCSRVVIIHQGRIVAEDSMENLQAGDSTLELEVDGPARWVRESLAKIPGVRSVDETGPQHFRVHASRDVAVDVSRRLNESSVGIRRLDTRQRTLEDVFMEAISAEEEPAA